MRKPAHVIDIFLQPGEFYFGERDTRIRTLLGSCVSITMWHPRRLIGGMCHFMLPSRGNKKIQTMDGRYAEEAIWMFVQEAVRNDTDPNDYVVKLFGGGNMFPHNPKPWSHSHPQCAGTVHSSCSNVSCKNIRIARKLITQYGLTIAAEHLGDTGHRQILFDIWSGHVWVKHNPIVLLPEGKKKEVSS